MIFPQRLKYLDFTIDLQRNAWMLITSHFQIDWWIINNKRYDGNWRGEVIKYLLDRPTKVIKSVYSTLCWKITPLFVQIQKKRFYRSNFKILPISELKTERFDNQTWIIARFISFLFFFFFYWKSNKFIIKTRNNNLNGKSFFLTKKTKKKNNKVFYYSYDSKIAVL